MVSSNFMAKSLLRFVAYDSSIVSLGEPKKDESFLLEVNFFSLPVVI